MTLLLGMGDNFGPEMSAALQLKTPGCQSPLQQIGTNGNGEPEFESLTQRKPVPIPIALYKDGARVAKTADCDNVARFLRQAGYHAIVPGREDFLYSSTWLARIAHEMSATPGPVMLAANLKLKLKPPLKQPKDPSAVFDKGDKSKDHYDKWNPLLFANCDKNAPEDLRDLDCAIDPMEAKSKNAGYAIVELGPQKVKVLVVGVVAKETMGAIAPTNKEMCFFASHAEEKKQEKNQAENRKNWLRSVGCHRNDLEKIQTAQEAYAEFDVDTGDPLKAALDALRAAEQDNKDIAYRILMAQMPRTEAEELAAKLRSTREPVSRFDLVISEAQFQHNTPGVEMSYYESGGAWDVTPVVTPYRAYREECKKKPAECKDGDLSWGLFRPESRVTLSTVQEKRTVVQEKRTVRNTPPDPQSMAGVPNDGDVDGAEDTAMHRLMVALDQVGSAKYSYTFVFNHADEDAREEVYFSPTAKRCSLQQSDKRFLEACEAALTKYLLTVMQGYSRTDVALLERRDVFLGYLPPKYAGYDAICPKGAAEAVCHLRVALDRVLWKGDYSQRVMVNGKDIQSMLKTSSDLKDEESKLRPNDIFDQSLVSFGIMSQPESSPTPSNDLFAIPATLECPVLSSTDYAGSGAKKAYCVNGEAIRSDHAYSVVTTDHLASDTQVYTAMSGLPSNYREPRVGYLTQRIADFVVARSKKPGTGGQSPGLTMALQEDGVMQNTLVARSSYESSSVSSANASQATGSSPQDAEEEHQDRGVMQIDIAKVVAGYNARLPQSGDQNIADKFQGATDTRASSPSSAELDLEAKIRVLRKVWHDKTNRFSFGIGSQDEFAYDRSVQGNLGGNAVNASYPLNSSTAGGFLQFGYKVRPKKKKQGTPGIFDGKSMIVIAPFQYQRQIVGSYLFFPFASSKAELTLHSPIVDGFSHRFGWRGEGAKYRLWDPGTYAEIGWQVVVQSNLLSAVTLSTPGTPDLTCPPPDRSVTINTCFKNAGYVVGPKTTASQTLTTLHSKGLYWDIHWQKGLVPLSDKNGITLSFDSSGDWFAAKAGLPSQTRYDIPMKFALTFPIFRNFGIGPAYSPFFYSNQVNHKSLVVQNFALSARWYFARDAAVRLDRQAVFNGPGSADETKTSRIK
jgi:hypothetical protein